MNNKMISIIVPVYNVEKYLAECVDSLLGQTYKDFEVILVDDGSKDKSGAICDEYAQKDDRIKVIHKENGGLSDARNKGLAASKGQYICFIDSDDYVYEDYLEKLYEAISVYKADVAVSDIHSMRLPNLKTEYEGNISMDRQKVWDWLCDHISREYVLIVSQCNKLYKRSVLEGLAFPTGLEHEDEYMTNDVINKSPLFVFVPKELYFYRENPESITENKADIRRLDFIGAYDQRIGIALLEGNKASACATFKNGLSKMTHYYPMGGEIAKKAQNRYKEYYLAHKELLSYKQRAKYSLFIISPAVYCKIFRIS